MTPSILLDRPPLQEAYDRVRNEYGGAIGRPTDELVTPALVLDLPAARRNIAQMAEQLRELPAEIRPHIKVHKSPDLARLQVEAGAIGLSVATVWEAIVLVRSGSTISSWSTRWPGRARSRPSPTSPAAPMSWSPSTTSPTPRHSPRRPVAPSGS